MNLSRIVVDPAEDPLWRDLVTRVPSSVFHAPAWLRVLRDTYGFDVKAALLVGGGRPVAGFVYVEVDDMMDRRIVSLPFSDFCDPLVADRNEWDRLMTPLLENHPVRVRLRCLFNELPSADPRFTQVSRAKWHAVELGTEQDLLWTQIDGSARRAIRKARARGVTVRRARERADVRSFFELHRKVRKYKYRLLPQPYRFFDAIWEHLLEPGHGVLLLAEYEGAVIGAILYLKWGRTLYYKFNASDTDQLDVRPNDLLIWEGIAYAMQEGLELLDFGLSDWDQEGLLRYKRKYATQERTITFLDHVPTGFPSSTDQRIRTLLPALTDLFVRDDVPDGVTEAAGDVLYRYFT